MNRQLQELGLTNAQGHIIGFIAGAKEPPCARDLETAFGLSHPTVSGLLSRMESKGFIALEPDPADRRIKRICLLEKGQAGCREICRRIHETEQAMEQGFTEQELVLFRSFLSRAINNLSEPTPMNREE